MPCGVRKEKVIGALTGGLAQLAKRRNVSVVQGQAIASLLPTRLRSLLADGGSQTLTFDHCILASGSRPARIPAFRYRQPASDGLYRSA
jgi:dihydrolipoamide dehydrogenase